MGKAIVEKLQDVRKRLKAVHEEAQTQWTRLCGETACRTPAQLIALGSDIASDGGEAPASIARERLAALLQAATEYTALNNEANELQRALTGTN